MGERFEQRIRAKRGWKLLAVVVAGAALAGLAAVPGAQAASCVPPAGANEIVVENCKQGNPASEWEVSGAGDASIQGFATEISVAQGATVRFKVDTDASAYRLDIYRMGYYGGDGARFVTTVQPSATLPQNQPACDRDAETGLVDCANWSESASWQVPANVTSGIYFARLVRANGSASHVVFVVRDDDGGSDLLFQTSDTTWQAYNAYGGNSLYTGDPAGRAYEVSYNRPFSTREGSDEDWLFNAEYPMVRWLERNGYDVSYSTGVDSDRRGAELLEHRAFLSVGHDEYWSGTQRANVEAARDAGVNLAFFSGNEVFWKTRWEDDHRTLVTYKETHANEKIDPLSGVWTGTWRDPRFSPPADGGRPENALTGTIFTVNAGSAALQVPAEEGKLRLWRNTTVAGLLPGAVATLTDDTVGYEWDEDLDNGARPAGLIRLSSTTKSGVDKLQDYGSTYGSGTATHHLTLYRDTNGAAPDALVFGAGTVQWPWGLDSNHDRGGDAPDVRMQQATVNLLADMSAQPSTLQDGLTAATASTDAAPPTVTITSPAAGTTVEPGTPVTFQGTAADAGGRVGAVEVSVDGGASWHPATGRDAWTYTWTPNGAGPLTLRSRAADDSGNLGAPTSVPVTVGGRTCPCSLFGTTTPANVAVKDPGDISIEVGVRFRADQDGFITGLRYHRGATWTGTVVGHLWTEGGTLLATAALGGSGQGWQQATLPQPVAVARDTTYVASYLSSDGFYAADGGFFATPFSAEPLHAAPGVNGVYRYGGGFPTADFNATNYWADVVFTPADSTPPTVTAVVPADGSAGVAAATKVSATFDEPLDASTVNPGTIQLRAASGALVPAAVGYGAGTRTATLTPASPLAAGALYTATVATGVEDLAGNQLAQAHTWSFTIADPSADPDPQPDPGGEPADRPAGKVLPSAVKPGTGTSATAPADRVPPRVRVSPRRVRVSRKGAAELRVGCPAEEERCRVSVRLRFAHRDVAARTVTVNGGRLRSISLGLSSSARRALVRERSLGVTAIATARDVAGNRATTRTSVRLIAPNDGRKA
jgi:hypothetical protein